MPDRDLIGYGQHPPHPRWPGGARVAVQFVLNIEEGAESAVCNGDDRSESYLHELPGRPARVGARDPSVESLYEYGARVGVWRILDLFRTRNLPLTAFVVGRALELNPHVGSALVADGHEVAGHGYRWLDYHGIAEHEEREHIHRTFDIIERACGKPPVGWYTGRVSANTLRLLLEHGGLLYSSDAYNDDLPYWLPTTPPHLIIPYTLVNNDMRYLMPGGVVAGADFFRMLKDAFDYLWREGDTRPGLMSIGLHARISGHPARAAGLARFLDYVQRREAVWVCRREDIARHWRAEYPPPTLSQQGDRFR